MSPQPKMVAEFPKVHEYGGGVFALSPSGKRVVAGVTLGGVGIDVDTGKELATLPAGFSHGYFRDESTFVGVQRSHDFSKPQAGKVIVWDVSKNADAGSFTIPDDRFDYAAPARNGAELWLFQSAGRFEVEVYDVAAKKLARTIKPEPVDPKQTAPSSGTWKSVAPDGSAFSTNVTLAQKVYNGVTGKIVGGVPDGVWGLSGGLVPGGPRYLGLGSVDAKAGGPRTDLILCDWKVARRLAVLTGFAGSRLSAGASADGKTVVAVSEEGEGLIFDVSAVK